MDKLAIVVPCYNEEEVLKLASEALRGVLDDLVQKGKITGMRGKACGKCRAPVCFDGRIADGEGYE